MKKFLEILSRLSLLIAALSLLSMTVIISYQVIARYFFNDSPAWSERLSLVLLAYLVFFGAAVGVHQRFHIRIDALHSAVPPVAARAIDVVANLAVLVAGLVMLLAGLQLTTTLWPFDIPSLGLPRGLALLPLPISGALIMLFAGAHLVSDAKADMSKPKEAE